MTGGSPRRAALSTALMVAASLALTLLLVERRGEGSPPRRPEREPLRFDATSESCEGCHPRHTAEWRRSVMAHAASSPLFQSLELLIEEQVGRDDRCPEGAGVLRHRGGGGECVDPESGIALTGSGGEGWCVSCHAPGENLREGRPGWDARRRGPGNRPLGELLSPAGREGIGCTACHQTHGPVRAGAAARGEYEGNPVWTSAATGARFSFRPTPHDRRFGIGNSGYRLDPAVLLELGAGERVPGGAHRRVDPDTRRYLSSSEFCGSCHDVRLFGTDALSRGVEHFKRLRNAYSEWLAFADAERRGGREAPSCQACHLSTFPGICEPVAEGARGLTPGDPCPPGSRFSRREPGALPLGLVATLSEQPRPVHPHYFSGVDVPLSREFDPALADEQALDTFGLPLGARARRDLLLARTLRLTLSVPERAGGIVRVPVTIENVAAGHRVPAGFSQERELWLHLTVRDRRGRVVYEVGRVDRDDQDLADKVFLRVNTDDGLRDEQGRPLGVFGADVADGPDAPRWSPPPELGGRSFTGRGLVNFQNGFLRCVRCIGVIDASGACQPLPGQTGARGFRYDDGRYDPDSGRCDSNLSGRAALFETYFPVGALDSRRGLVKAPDAIIDTRSLAPNEPVTYVYEIEAPRGELSVEARLLFRAFPPFLIRAFADYERRMARRGVRPRGPLVTESMLERIDVVELDRVTRRGG